MNSSINSTSGRYPVNDVNKLDFNTNSIENGTPTVTDLTHETKLGWMDWARQTVIPSKETVINFVWETEVSYVLNTLFNEAVWPVVEGYVPCASNPFLQGIVKAVTQGTFIAVGKEVVNYTLSNEEPDDKDGKNSSFPVFNQETWSKGIYKGSIKGVAYIPTRMVKHYTQINISKAYFSAAIENFAKNKEEVRLYKRVTTAILTGFVAGNKKEFSVFLTNMQFEAGKTVINWLSKNFTGIEISPYIDSFKNALGNNKDKKMPVYMPGMNPKFSYGSNSNKGQCYFNTNPLNSFDVTGRCEAIEDSSNSFYEIFLKSQEMGKSKKK